ncbi:MAG: signal peptidase II [Bacteroides sp.]|nr:signal peptidase II [Bacteroides sp.]MCM1549342.1 signal peptidase II [Clostridium sp.]
MKYVKAIIGIFLLICLDQYAKYVVASRLELFTYHPILGDFFGLFYLENRGMAWGLFQNRQILFLILTIIILAFLGYCYGKLARDSKFRPLAVSIQFLIAGAIGNMIDRIFHGDILFQGAVVDFFYIKCIDFPVFNIADLYVTISIAVIGCLLLFRYKEEDFEGLFFFTRKRATSQAPEKPVEQMELKEETETNNDRKTGYMTTESEEAVDINALFSDEEEEDE